MRVPQLAAEAAGAVPVQQGARLRQRAAERLRIGAVGVVGRRREPLIASMRSETAWNKSASKVVSLVMVGRKPRRCARPGRAGSPRPAAGADRLGLAQREQRIDRLAAPAASPRRRRSSSMRAAGSGERRLSVACCAARCAGRARLRGKAGQRARRPATGRARSEIGSPS